jgi:transposase InsO family protein
MFIRDHRNEFRVWLMCRVLRVSRSGYYAWQRRPVSNRKKANEALVIEIGRVYQQSRRTYGSPRMTDELNAVGIACGRHRVARLMRANGIKAKTAPKFRVTTDSKHAFAVAENLLARQFTVSRPNAVWVADITYIWTLEGWLYLAVVLDLYARRIVGWAMSHRIDGDLTLSALRQALAYRRPSAGLIHHSDRGKQYAAGGYQILLREYGIVCSMSRKGDCWDNAPMESFFGTLKQELVYHERFATRDEAKAKIFEYIEVFYNRQRRHSAAGSHSPVEFERLTPCLN